MKAFEEKAVSNCLNWRMIGTIKIFVAETITAGSWGGSSINTWKISVKIETFFDIIEAKIDWTVQRVASDIV